VTYTCIFKFSIDWTVFKDGGKEEKKKDTTTSSSVKCYFVRTGSGCSADLGEDYILSKKTMYESRLLFMHAHQLPSIDKYMARYDIYVDTIF
jgi:RNA-dependent RNA polymerase